MGWRVQVQDRESKQVHTIICICLASHVCSPYSYDLKFVDKFHRIALTHPDLFFLSRITRTSMKFGE